jgi:hypothetical protein
VKIYNVLTEVVDKVRITKPEINYLVDNTPEVPFVIVFGRHPYLVCYQTITDNTIGYGNAYNSYVLVSLCTGLIENEFRAPSLYELMLIIKDKINTYKIVDCEIIIKNDEK